MPHGDTPNGEGTGQIFFIELREDHREQETDVLSGLSNDLGRLDIKEQAALGRVSFHVSFQSRPFPYRFQRPEPESEDEPEHVIDMQLPSGCVPTARGWSHMLSSRP